MDQDRSGGSTTTRSWVEWPPDEADDPGLEQGRFFDTLSEEDCRERLLSRLVGRIAWWDGNAPIILPVTYVYDGDVILFRTAAVGPLTALSGGSPVAFQVDEFDPGEASGWSVLVRGRASDHLPDGGPAPDWPEEAPAAWIDDHGHVVICITVASISGRVLSRTPDPDSVDR